MSFTLAQVSALAPDSETARLGRNLSFSKRWIGLEGNGNYLWGEIQIGRLYCKVGVDLIQRRFLCNCKSSRSPCKHALALLFIFLQNNEAFRVCDTPPKWMRSLTNSDLSPKLADTGSAGLPKKPSASRQKRLELMSTGAIELESWLFDLIRQGLATTEAQKNEFWEEMATRLVDSKLAGVAQMLRRLSKIYQTGVDWPQRMLSELANIYLLVKGFQRLDHLPVPLKGILLSTAGVNFKREELLKKAGVPDHWWALGYQSGVQDKLRFRRTYLLGINSRRLGLILEYAWGDTPLPALLPIGKVFHGTLVYYPSSFPLRALIKEWSEPQTAPPKLQGYPSIRYFLKNYAKAIGTNPWLQQYPGLLAEVRPLYFKDVFILLDQEGSYLPFSSDDSCLWQLLALSGGNPVDLFGEWNGSIFVPLSIWSEGRFVAFHS